MLRPRPPLRNAGFAMRSYGMVLSALMSVTLTTPVKVSTRSSKLTRTPRSLDQRLPLGTRRTPRPQAEDRYFRTARSRPGHLRGIGLERRRPTRLARDFAPRQSMSWAQIHPEPCDESRERFERLSSVALSLIEIVTVRISPWRRARRSRKRSPPRVLHSDVLWCGSRGRSGIDWVDT